MPCTALYCTLHLTVLRHTMCVLQVDDVVLAGTVCLPWACRIMDYAR